MKKVDLLTKLGVCLAGFSVIVGLAACNTASEPVAEVPEIEQPESIVELESKSEEISEEVSEEISEEPIEEIVDYSASSVIAFSEELMKKYPEQDPMEIVAGVVIANCDYIEPEELEIIFEKYGCTIEDLETKFNSYFTDYLELVLNSYCTVGGQYFDGEVPVLNDGLVVIPDELMMEENENKHTVDVMIDAAINDGDEKVEFVHPEDFPDLDYLAYNDENLTVYSKYVIIKTLEGCGFERDYVIAPKSPLSK